MELGIVGLPTVGKTTLFNLLTQANLSTAAFGSAKAEAHTRIARVPDQRIDTLSEIWRPRKTTYAQIKVTEVPGLVQGSSQGMGVGNAFLNAIRQVDALLHVVRAFTNDEVVHSDGSINPMRDIDTVNVELLLSDLQLVENRIERINAGKKKKEQELELALMERLKEALENGLPIQSLSLTDEERALLANYAFLTERPQILVVNLDEEQYKAGDWPGAAAVKAYAAERKIPLLEICARIEMEISQLEPEDRDLFMADLGITESGISRLARAAYDLLGLISFLTVGEDEVRAWTIRRGTTAKEAGGKIHSDIERGFIRAEVVAYNDLMAAGNMAKAREQGHFRLEGKEYIVHDGDIINFRFNV
ncbi:MAG TPA: redox-regulated ATPase YchF [Symbiobacteriaceae bacterium]|nr:redox-regulated ATPase YchF [Symbiobacteriaceae bacterium]